MRLLSTFALIAALAWSGAASAGSTINPSAPAQGSALTSGPVRSNFAAAYNDINGIEGMFAGSTAPPSPLQGQDWLNTSVTTAATWSKWNTITSTWTLIGTFNLNTGVFTAATAGCPTCAFTNVANVFSALQTVDFGSGSRPTTGAGAGAVIYSADGVAARFEITEFNNAVSGAYAIFDGRTSLGSRGAPLTVTSGTMLTSFEGKGYDGSVWTGTGGALHVYARGTFTPTSHQGGACLATTASGATATTDNLCVNSDGTASLVGALTSPSIIGAAGNPLVLVGAAGQSVQLGPNTAATVALNSSAFEPINDNSISLGFSSNRWSNIYGVAATVTTVTSPASTNLAINAPTGQNIEFEINGAVQASVNGSGLLVVGNSGAQPGTIQIASPTANVMAIVSASSATGTATIPSGSYTLVGDTTTQTLTNKTWNGVAVAIGFGGTGQATASAAIAALMPTPTRAGDVPYWNGSIWTTLPGNNSGTLTLQENASGVPVWASVAGTGTVTSATIAGSGGNTTSGTCTITTSGTCQVAAPGGFLNFLRNSSLSSWFHGGAVGSPITITTAGGWCAEGVWVLPTGASVTCVAISTSTVGTPYYNLKITGNTSVTDVVARFVVESYTHSRFFNKNVTFQMEVVNTTGGTITPTLQTKYATAGQDSWGTSTIDLAATNLQACTNTSTCLEAYTLAVSGAGNNGYEFNVDLGNNFSTNGKNVQIVFFDARLDPNASTGLNANPPPFEMRDPESDIRWNERFVQTSYDNFTAPGAATHTGMAGGAVSTATPTNSQGWVTFRTPMRAAPAVSTWDGAGAANKQSHTGCGGGVTFVDGDAPSLTSGLISTKGFAYSDSTTSACPYTHFLADSSITGG